MSGLTIEDILSWNNCPRTFELEFYVEVRDLKHGDLFVFCDDPERNLYTCYQPQKTKWLARAVPGPVCFTAKESTEVLRVYGCVQQ